MGISVILDVPGQPSHQKKGRSFAALSVSAELEIEDGNEFIMIGVMTDGSGTLWIDDLLVEQIPH
jgi:hypothetical protein